MASHCSIESHHKVPGSTWLLKQDGKPWPVVLCSKETVPTAFYLKRPDNGYLFPALVLGKYMYVWYCDADLKPYDPCKSYITADNNDEKYERAFNDAAHFNTDAEWYQILVKEVRARALKTQAKSQKREQEKSESNSDTSQVIKHSQVRKTLKASNTASGDRSLRVHKKRYSSYKHKSIRMETHGLTPELLGEEEHVLRTDFLGEEFSDDECFFSGSMKGIGKASSSDLFVNDTSKNTQAPRVRKRQTEKLIFEEPISDEKCALYVGKEGTKFIVPKAAMEECDLLKKHTQLDAKIGTYVKCNELTVITAKEFVPVAEFMCDSDFHPYGYRDPMGRDRLETQPGNSDLPITLAYIFNTALSLKMRDLQELVQEKIRTIYPMDLLLLTIVVKIIFSVAPKSDVDGDAAEQLRDYLVDHVFEYYYKLMEVQPSALRRVLLEHCDFATGVHAKLVENPQGGRQGIEDDDGFIRSEY